MLNLTVQMVYSEDKNKPKTHKFYSKNIELCKIPAVGELIKLQMINMKFCVEHIIITEDTIYLKAIQFHNCPGIFLEARETLINNGFIDDDNSIFRIGN